MPLVLTVSQLLQSSEGSVPEAFRGAIKKVFNPNSGKNATSGEPWKLQKLVIAEGKEEIEVMFDNRDDVSRGMEGGQLYVVAGRGARGLTGTKMKLNTHKGANKLQAWVYDSADVNFEGGSQRPESPPARQQQRREDPPPAQKPANGNGANGHHSDGYSDRAPTNGANGSHPPEPKKDIKTERLALIRTYDKRIARTKAGLLRAYDAAMQLVQEVDTKYAKNGGFKATPSDIKEIASTIFIQANWTEKVTDLEAFPMREFQYYLDEAERAHEAAAHTEQAPPPQQRAGQPFR